MLQLPTTSPRHRLGPSVPWFGVQFVCTVRIFSGALEELDPNCSENVPRLMNMILERLISTKVKSNKPYH